MKKGQASWTAVLVCQGRAAADGRLAVGRFADPVAISLLRKDERRAVERVREGRPPIGWSRRVQYQALRATADVIVPRTVVIDDAVRARPTPQVVILGAGLDSRAWRMPELAEVDVFEVDHPASQVDKLARLEGRESRVKFVAVDFATARLDEALVTAGHRSDVATTWIWEGVVPYLRRADVVATVRALSVLSDESSRVIVHYQAPSLVAAVGRRAASLVRGSRSPWSHEPVRSTWWPGEVRALLHRFGFTVIADDDLLTVARELDLPIRERHSLRTGHVAVADR